MTGVQTCALPISFQAPLHRPAEKAPGQALVRARLCRRTQAPHCMSLWHCRGAWGTVLPGKFRSRILRAGDMENPLFLAHFRNGSNSAVRFGQVASVKPYDSLTLVSRHSTRQSSSRKLGPAVVDVRSLSFFGKNSRLGGSRSRTQRRCGMVDGPSTFDVGCGLERARQRYRPGAGLNGRRGPPVARNTREGQAERVTSDTTRSERQPTSNSRRHLQAATGRDSVNTVKSVNLSTSE